MPFFTRRRLQHMLAHLATHLSDKKQRDLHARLESSRVDQALPAEMELGLLWALSSIGEIEVEPEWWEGNGRPDAYTESLFPGVPTAIEIAAPNDNRISGEEAMDRIAEQFCTFANKIRRGVGSHLYFKFMEESGYEGNQYFRRRLAPANYQLTAKAIDVLRSWIESGEIERVPLRIVETGLDVEIEKRKHKQIRYHRVWSSMPPETHSIENNPLYELLRRKLDQLGGTPAGILRYIFLADAGSTLLRRIGSAGEIDSTRRRVSGREIISQFVRDYSDRLDSVVVFAPHRKSQLMNQGRLEWSIVTFDRPGLEVDDSGLARLAESLPAPRFEGYQARSLFRQGAFSPKARGWHLGMTIYDSRNGQMNVKVSARALVDLLAGRITAEQFRFALGERDGEKNLFKHWLELGMTLSDVEVESGGVDKDDNYLVLKFSDDPAARVLQLPDVNKGKAE
jgi:hypothetical protein